MPLGKWRKNMLVIACIDERKGMLFNHRRQSRDSVVSADILRECAGETLYMSNYSRALFQNTNDVKIIISEDMKSQVPADGICFVEDADVFSCTEQIDQIILYQWNRHYPADIYLPLDLSGENWKLVKQEELTGYSHDRITKEVYYRRKENE